MTTGVIMFGLFKSNPLKKLQKEYDRIMEQAVSAQRNGKLELYGELTKKAQEIEKKRWMNLKKPLNSPKPLKKYKSLEFCQPSLKVAGFSFYAFSKQSKPLIKAFSI
jgi:hypothetical protein